MELKVRTLADYVASGESPEILFWVGCAGTFDERARKVTRAVAKLLQAAGVSFAVLGTEESCTGDPARRAGHEFDFQMLAQQNIAVMNGYGVRRIVTACPHCFNTIKNEYPDLGGQYEIVHHTQLINQLMAEGRLKVEGGSFSGKRITFHDPCYLGRGNGEYEAPRELLSKLDGELVEMKRSRARGLCCGAGGAQMFKEAEPGNKEINSERAEEALSMKPQIIAVGCPFCNTMMTDGVKNAGKDGQVQVMDIAELILKAADL